MKVPFTLLPDHFFVYPHMPAVCLLKPSGHASDVVNGQHLVTLMTVELLSTDNDINDLDVSANFGFAIESVEWRV